MTFKDTFCPSPWFHTRINNSGNYEYCRWAVKDARQAAPSIRDIDPVTWFQQEMNGIRKSMLDGHALAGCKECALVEQHGKVSGRQRQLLKIGVTVADFEKSILSSPWLDTLKKSQDDGYTDQLPQDWQIDLGNFCNSACLFCDPHSSSKLAAEFKRIGFIQEMPPRAWCDDPHLLESFINVLRQTPRLAYLHFIGGETLITPAFRTILKSLVENKLAQQVSLGFTTNLTTWDDEIVDLLKQFKEINLGMSVECLHPLNDYVRYGSEISTVKKLLHRWISVARQHNWLIQLRITPTILSIWHLDSIYEFAMEQEIAVESCNFLNDPAHMRPSVLPAEWRQAVIQKLQTWINQQANLDDVPVINTRNPDLAKKQIVQDAMSYVDYLLKQPDESWRLKDLVEYLQIMEQSRNNRILDYLPEYEKLLRSAGY